MPNYGYDPSKYIKDYSWLGDIGNTISRMAVKFPEIVRLNKEVKENKRLKEGISSTTAHLIDNLDDNDAMRIANSMGVLAEIPNATPEQVKEAIKGNIPTFTDQTTNEEYSNIITREFYPHFMNVEQPGRVLRTLEMMGGKSGQDFANNPFGQKVYKEQMVDEQEQKKAEQEQKKAELAAKHGQQVSQLVEGGMPLSEALAQTGQGPKAVGGAIGKEQTAAATQQRHEDDLELRKQGLELRREEMNLRKELAKAKKDGEQSTVSLKDTQSRINTLDDDKVRVAEKIALLDPKKDKDLITKLKETEKRIDKNIQIAIELESILADVSTTEPVTKRELPIAEKAARGQVASNIESDLVQRYKRGEFGEGEKGRLAFEESFRQATGREAFYDDQGNPIQRLPEPPSFEQLRGGRKTQPQQSMTKEDLARKALNDPNAPEAVKAQARKILGL